LASTGSPSAKSALILATDTKTQATGAADFKFEKEAKPATGRTGRRQD
jgi:hypothetical protein